MIEVWEEANAKRKYTKEEMREQRMDIKSFVYFSIFYPFSYIMNIITILITLVVSHLIGISRMLVEDIGANWTDGIRIFSLNSI